MLNCLKPLHCLAVLAFSCASLLISGCGGADSSTTETPKRDLNILVTIPVVFHVIVDPNKPESNVSDDMIKTQMQVLNQVFSQNNEEIAFLGDLKSLTEDTQIRFELAKLTEDGKPFSGINRFIDVRPGSAQALEWPHQRYLNVWIDNLESRKGDLHILGSTKLHCYDGGDTASFYSDGIEIHYETLLVNNTYKARTLVHEVGHWLGLSHATGAEDSCNPLADSNIFQAGGLETGTLKNTEKFCSNNNLMQGLAQDQALNIFTRGQSYLMKKAFAPGNCRAELYQNLTRNP